MDVSKSGRYYFDTSIWLDLFEDRDEPNLLKGKIVQNLIAKIIRSDYRIIYADIVGDELKTMGYTDADITSLFVPFSRIILDVEASERQFRRAKELAQRRDIPLFDALHALIARDQWAVLVSRDHHFKVLADIVVTKKPEELI